jgi:PAS domain S-box-containing protein
MITLDMKTVMLGNVIINFVCLIVMLILWGQNRNKYPGLFYWVIDWALQAGGALLIALRGTIPNWASMVLSNSMIVGGNLILFFGLCRFAGKKISPSLKYLVLIGFAIFVSVHSYYVFIHDVLLIRSFNASIGLSLGSFMGMWLLFKGANPEIRRISRGTAISLTIIVLISLVRMIGFVLLPQITNDYLREGFFDTSLVLLLSGAIVFLVFNLVLMVTMRLYTESKRLQEAVAKSEKELQATFNTTSVGFVILVNRVIKEVNDAVIQTFGYPREELIGNNTRLFYATEEEYQAGAQLYPKIAEAGAVTAETRLVRKDGEIRNALMSISAFDRKDLSQGVVLSLLDITERKQTEEKIAHLASFPEMNPRPIIELTANGSIIYTNLASKSLFPDLESLGTLHPYLVDWQTVTAQLINGTGGHIEREIKIGERFYAQAISFMKDQDVFRIYGNNITERRQAEDKIKVSLAEKEVLLKEIQHRVKNNMQVIASLLHMQSTHVKDPRDASLFKVAQERIRSMALVYERLYQSPNLSHIDFNKYVTDLAGGLVHSYSIGPMTCRTVIDVPDIPINMDLAIPCGLIINEVVSNSLKYAFPDDRQGTISISIKVSDGNIEMTLADDGLGLPENLDSDQTASMGMSLIHALVEHQLGGKVEMERHGGTMYRITFPVFDKS